MAKKTPHPPPIEEERRFKALLKKLVAIPAAELQEQRREHVKRKKRG
jgi:hypothetical protein